MGHTVYGLNIANADNTAGTAQDIRDLLYPTVFIHGSGTYSLKVQVKISGKATPTTVKPAADIPAPPDVNDDWFDLKTGIVANAMVPIADPVSGAPISATHVRIYRTSLSAGSVAADVGGRR